MNETSHSLAPVARLVAESEISKLIATYAHLNDEGRFDVVADLLEYAEFDVVGQVATSRDEILAFLDSGIQRHADGSPRTWHTVSNVRIDIAPSGNKASAESYYTVHQQLDDFPLQPICTGKYLDRFERKDGKWRFARRAVTLNLGGDLSQHVKAPRGSPIEAHR